MDVVNLEGDVIVGDRVLFGVLHRLLIADSVAADMEQQEAPARDLRYRGLAGLLEIYLATLLDKGKSVALPMFLFSSAVVEIDELYYPDQFRQVAAVVAKLHSAASRRLDAEHQLSNVLLHNKSTSPKSCY